jgi:tricorn protease
MSQLSPFVTPRLGGAALVSLLLGTAGLAAPAAAQAPRFLRQPSISTDGSQIVFTYRGDLWKVSSQGGAARQLTSHPAYDTSPVFSPDGKEVAFASDRHGQLDVFVMDAAGGEARRLTFNSADDVPSAWRADGKQVYFTSGRLDAPDAYLTRMRSNELYAVDAAGGRAEMVLTTPADSARPSPDGRFLAYHDQKGFEDVFRKHHTSSVARDLWLFEPKTGRHQQLTTWKGEDRQPAFVDGGKALAFLSERDGSFNVYQMPLGPGAGDQLASPGEAKALTRFKQHPVRYLSAAGDGTLAFNILGDLYVMPPGGEAKKLAVEILADRQMNEKRLSTVTDGATEFAISPQGDEVAFVVRGEIFAASIEHGTTRRLTNTPQQERSLSFAPDGRSLYFAAERADSWDILKTSIVRADEERFFEATALKEEIVAGGPGEQFQPLVSPDGKLLAYLFDRDELRVRSLETGGGEKPGADKIVVPAKQNYSYQDGDIEYGFSPDSRWLAATYYGYRRWINEVGLIDLEKNQLFNLTDSGYHEGAPLWSPDGQALLFFSDREGKRSHGGHSIDGDIYSLAVDSAAFDRARLSVEELERLKKKEEEAEGKDGDKGGDKGSDKGKKDKKKKPVKPIAFELEGREARLSRLTLSSAPIADYDVSPDGESVVYIAKVEENWDVYLTKWRDRESSRLAELGDEQPGQVAFNADGDKVVVQKGDGKLVYLEVEGSGKKKNGNGGGGGGKPSAKPIAWKGELQIDPVAERRYFFDHAWRQVEQKFYQESLHGADWPALRQAYGAYLADLATPRDFVELLSEMLGELNASHTGSRFRPKPAADGDRTASLGLIYDPKDRGPGLLVAELLPRGPAKRAGSKIVPGARILSIDGALIGDKTDPAALLNRKEGQRVLVGGKDAKGQAFEEVVKPISQREEADLLYERFVEREMALVEKLSGGRIGYVHVAGMNDGSFRRFYRDALGRASDKEALIVDTRGNGGGWLHDDLVSFLEGRQYLRFQPRGKTVGEFGDEPLMRWSRPSVVVQNEENYSDAHVFPYVYKHLKVGKLVGSPVAGTGTAVWWERQIDGETIFGIPQVGLVTEDGKYLENLDLEPDVLVRNDPESVNRGRDRQIEKAVEVLLQELGPKK